MITFAHYYVFVRLATLPISSKIALLTRNIKVYEATDKSLSQKSS